MDHDLDAAIRRMRAIIGVLDEDLAIAERRLDVPVAPVELPPEVWERAEAARRDIVLSLAATEAVAADASRRARHWEENFAAAVQRGDDFFARQASKQAAMASDEAAALTLECRELQVFLTEWAVRVRQAPPIA